MAHLKYRSQIINRATPSIVPIEGLSSDLDGAA